MTDAVTLKRDGVERLLHYLKSHKHVARELELLLEDALAAPQPVKAQPVQPALVTDLSMMVRRLVLSIRRLAEDDTKDLTFANVCLDWLKAKGLAGSPLRDGPLEPQPVQPAPLTDERITEAAKSLGIGSYQTLAAAFKAGVKFAAPTVRPGRTNSGDETGGTVKRFGFDVSNGKSDIIPATNGAYVYYDDYLALHRKLEPQPAPVQPAHGLQHVHDAIMADPSVCDIEPVKQADDFAVREAAQMIKDSRPIQLDSTQSAAVGDYYWQPMATCPRSAKVQLLGRGGVATYGQFHSDPYWVGWALLPRKLPDASRDQ